MTFCTRCLARDAERRWNVSCRHRRSAQPKTMRRTGRRCSMRAARGRLAARFGDAMRLTGTAYGHHRIHFAMPSTSSWDAPFFPGGAGGRGCFLKTCRDPGIIKIVSHSGQRIRFAASAADARNRHPQGQQTRIGINAPFARSNNRSCSIRFTVLCRCNGRDLRAWRAKSKIFERKIGIGPP